MRSGGRNQISQENLNRTAMTTMPQSQSAMRAACERPFAST